MRVRQEQKEWKEKLKMKAREIQAQEKLLASLKPFFHNLCTDVMFTLVTLYPSSSLTVAQKKDKSCDTLLDTME